MYPSYTSFQPELGYISSVRPGSNVNGGIYVHACVFYIKANCALKENQKAWVAINKILPFSDIRNPVTGSPFSLPNAYWGPAGEYKFREYGGAWTTGSAGWLFSVIVYDIFGLKSTWKGISLDPCLPPHWKTCSISRNFRNAQYKITYLQRKRGPCNQVKKIIVDGELYKEKVLPYEEGKTFHIQVELGSKKGSNPNIY
jgi:cellobiose phosphorylase